METMSKSCQNWVKYPYEEQLDKTRAASFLKTNEQSRFLKKEVNTSLNIMGVIVRKFAL